LTTFLLSNHTPQLQLNLKGDQQEYARNKVILEEGCYLRVAFFVITFFKAQAIAFFSIVDRVEFDNSSHHLRTNKLLTVTAKNHENA